MKEYKAITKMLNDYKNLSLELYFIDISSGIKNFRTAAIFEPDPNEGEVANPESGLDQQFLHGPRRKRYGFAFKAKHTNQALNLLERTCNGKKGLKNKVQQSWDRDSIPYVHGYKLPKPGLDTWVFNDFQFTIQQKGDEGLFLDITSGEFYIQGSPVSSKKIESVGEGLALYEENIVENSIIRNMQQGMLLRNRISKYMKWKFSEEDLSLIAKGIITKKFLDEYKSALESVDLFNISKEVKEGLFTSMLLENFYSKRK